MCTEQVAVFEQEVAGLVGELTDPATSVQIVALLVALGCRLIYEPLHLWMDEPDQPPVEAETLVRQTLAVALHAHLQSHNSPHDEFILLDGLLRNDRWRDLLEAPEKAYDFADLVLSICGASPEVKRLRVTIENEMSVVFLTWLGLELDTYPSAPDLAAAMFGSAWVDLITPDYIISPSFPEHFHVLAAMRATKPAFLPGLVTWQSKATALPLPEMG